jgi:hypothetical protein
MKRLIPLLLLCGLAHAQNSTDKRRLEDECFERIKPLLEHARVERVETGRAHPYAYYYEPAYYRTTFYVQGMMPPGYPFKKASCDFNSSKRILRDDYTDYFQHKSRQAAEAANIRTEQHREHDAAIRYNNRR